MEDEVHQPNIIAKNFLQITDFRFYFLFFPKERTYELRFDELK